MPITYPPALCDWTAPGLVCTLEQDHDGPHVSALAPGVATGDVNDAGDGAELGDGDVPVRLAMVLEQLEEVASELGRCMDALPELRHGNYAVQRERLRDVEDHAGTAWAHVRFAITGLRQVRTANPGAEL